MMFIPYSCQNITNEDVAAVTAALRSPFLTQGQAVPAFEQAFAARHQVNHAVAVSNATAALHLGCLALGAGPGTRVRFVEVSYPEAVAAMAPVDRPWKAPSKATISTRSG